MSARFGRATRVLWDSLLLAALARRPKRYRDGTHGLLVHYLPFRDPALGHGERRRWSHRFDRVVGGMGFALATGAGVAAFLEQRFPGLPVGCCEPGIDPVFPAARRTPDQPREPGPVRIATIAHLLPAKGHGDLLEALGGLGHLAWEWHWVGADHLAPEHARNLRIAAAAVGLGARIVHHGVLPAPALARLLRRMDLVVQASGFESYGMALAEAVAAGVPVVATAVGEAERIVRHGETGFLVPAQDPMRLREAVARLLLDAALRQRFRERSTRLPPRTWEAAFDDFVRFLGRVAAA